MASPVRCSTLLPRTRFISICDTKLRPNSLSSSLNPYSLCRTSALPSRFSFRSPVTMTVNVESVGARPVFCTSRPMTWLMNELLPELWLPSTSTSGHPTSNVLGEAACPHAKRCRMGSSSWYTRCTSARIMWNKSPTSLVALARLDRSCSARASSAGEGSGGVRGLLARSRSATADATTRTDAIAADATLVVSDMPASHAREEGCVGGGERCATMHSVNCPSGQGHMCRRQASRRSSSLVFPQAPPRQPIVTFVAEGRSETLRSFHPLSSR